MLGHAVVVGGGMAGLVTARVLADSFERVTLLEQDPDPPRTGSRSGVPQGRHFHALLPGGLQILSTLLPGLEPDLQAGGSLRPGPSEFYFFRPEGRSYSLAVQLPEPPPDDGDRSVYVQTRGLLEGCVRERVAQVEGVELRHGVRVDALEAESGRVCGVWIEGEGDPLAADLVVDATGRGGRVLRWLDKLGFERPREEVIHCDFAYTSVFLRPRTPDLFRDVGFFVMADPSHPRGGALVRMEGGIWIVSVGGRYGDYPPRDLAGMIEYAASMREPLLADLVSQADPVSEPAHYRFRQSIRRRFDQLEHFPEGLLPIGDAICHYNPVYGQGMSAASRQALALQRVLREWEGRSLDGLWREFLPAAYEETRAPWLFGALMDFSHPSCTGDFPNDEQESIRLLGHIMGRAASGDREALGALARVQLMRAPLALLSQPPWPERLAASESAG